MGNTALEVTFTARELTMLMDYCAFYGTEEDKIVEKKLKTMIDCLGMCITNDISVHLTQETER